MIKKKRYAKPVLTAIALDPKQAIIQSCVKDGTSFSGGTRCMGVSTGGAYNCHTALRGRGAGTPPGTSSGDSAQPS